MKHKASLHKTWHRFSAQFGSGSTILITIFVVIIIILLIIILLLKIAKRKQQHIDDKRTSLDMLERGRLTPIRDLPLPAIPVENSDEATVTVVASSGMAVEVSPPPGVISSTAGIENATVATPGPKSQADFINTSTITNVNTSSTPISFVQPKSPQDGSQPFGLPTEALQNTKDEDDLAQSGWAGNAATLSTSKDTQ